MVKIEPSTIAGIRTACYTTMLGLIADENATWHIFFTNNAPANVDG